MINYLQLCRAISKETNEWMIGFYRFQKPDRHCIIVSSNPDMIIEAEIIPTTLGVCTGTYDPRGHVIFTGDCLGHSLNTVEFTNGSFNTNGDRDLYLQAQTLYVIGNLHDGVVENVPYLRDLLDELQRIDVGIDEISEDGESTYTVVPDMSDREIVCRLTGIDNR